MAKKLGTSEPPGKPLEEWIPVDFQVVGLPEWFDETVPLGVLPDRKRVVVSGWKDPKFLEIVHWLSRQKVLGIDSETTASSKREGLDPWRPTTKLLLAQIGTEDKVYIFQPELLPGLQQVLEDKKQVHILHNAVYDFKYLLVKLNIHINNIYDTMLTEQLLTCGVSGKRVGLAEVVRRYEPRRIISKAVRNQFADFAGYFTDDMFHYAARDILLMFPVYHGQQEPIRRFGMKRIQQIEFDLIPATAQMELGGVLLDANILSVAQEYWSKREKELALKISQVYDRELRAAGYEQEFLLEGVYNTFNVKSPKQKMEALAKIGIDLEDTQWDTLKAVDHEIARLLMDYSEALKITSTYGENMIRRINPLTGHFHPVFAQMGRGDMDDAESKATIATGRYSSDFQQIPRESELFCYISEEEAAELLPRLTGGKCLA